MLLFCATPIVLLGGLLAYFCRKELALAWQSRGWPQAIGHISGRVVHEGVGLGTSTDGTMAPMEQRFREIDLLYSYPVAGQTYESSRLSFSAGGWWENTKYYDEGDEVAVYYCPSDPSIAVLQPGFTPTLLTGPFIFALGLGAFAYGLCTL